MVIFNILFKISIKKVLFLAVIQLLSFLGRKRTPGRWSSRVVVSSAASSRLVTIPRSSFQNKEPEDTSNRVLRATFYYTYNPVFNSKSNSSPTTRGTGPPRRTVVIRCWSSQGDPVLWMSASLPREVGAIRCRSSHLYHLIIGNIKSKSESLYGYISHKNNPGLLPHILLSIQSW